ncbi:hypothetical protein SODALDRAFT_348524 [Sodiomyces alkalinus F11]|uniref:Peroxisomal membrane protein PEX14 n=1 Tax=Sodiomyces alkalinus (strain CBS 110278 / VKM F-3762 / F11) TaxID=1314773 RepID=A0A3N2Q0E4_SODAK|nr:hypothetical protein SODALDRAFT_348524 [Sodiomyces alkalinus F11]ROT40237.1 hypothetical protein SODALDRAFT_348524 [Sodiomyces alkalinus F11]
MGENEEKQTAPAIPAWQRDRDGDLDQEKPGETPSPVPDTTTMDVARRFLQDDQIKNTSREHKADFLRTKGLPEEDIEKLLDEVEASHDDRPPPEPTPKSIPDAPSKQQDDTASTPQSDQPPIITYPEFLAKPPRPPPLVTATGVFNTLYAFAGLSTLLYGTSKSVVAPMVESLTEARTDLHETTSRKLSSLVNLLERTVSEIPPTISAAAGSSSSSSNTKAAARDAEDSDDDADDPTELFHRDVGVQTSPSLPPSPRLGEHLHPSGAASSSSESAIAQQTRKLGTLIDSLRGIKDTYVFQSEDLADVKTVLDTLKDDLNQITYPGGQADFVGSYSLYGSYGGRRAEPEDEIKKARDSIRRIKGVMLSTRSFPISTR